MSSLRPDGTERVYGVPPFQYGRRANTSPSLSPSLRTCEIPGKDIRMQSVSSKFPPSCALPASDSPPPAGIYPWRFLRYFGVRSPAGPLLPTSWRDTQPVNAGPTTTRGTVTPPISLPSPDYTVKKPSIMICTNYSNQRDPTTFHEWEIDREQDGRKATDLELVMALRESYYWRLRPPSRRLLSLQGLKHIVFVEFTNEEQAVPLVRNAKFRSDLIHAFNRPNLISTDYMWLDLICSLGADQYHNHGLMFVHDWDRHKIAVLIGVSSMVSILTAIIWIAGTGEVANAMAVSSYIMSATGVVVGMLAFLSAIED